MEDKATVLVTGATGFLGMQIILQLLENGYTVKATVRDLKSADQVIETLRKNNIRSFEKLTFIAAELTMDNNWEEAMQGCNYVISVASPVFFDKPKDEEEAFRPATEGILRILKYAKKACVKRVVMTSNFGAVGFTQTDTSRETTEADWTDTTNKAVSVYERSKTIAEKAAWEFIRKDGGNLEFATINPVAILGPSLDAHVSGSFHLLQNLLNGKIKVIPNIPLNIVDVRDVACLHIKAMEIPEANGKRFIASADGQISLPEIAELLKWKRPELSQKVSSKRMPNFVLSIASLFNHQAKEGILLAKMNRNLSTRNVKTILNWKPVATQEETILAAVDTLKKYELL
ncbi:aldehyde reductase [Pedobacter sp. MC2016-15]|uniref:SDR family oxidoreductase n=1 Tax=Pedobacter sp. MC2016-15 TaxID=2994473 RepID=UPI002246BB17|nr:aldehyde reductase [Pedobacter sp. MC2016-15]MCX2479381.1 aldehyde reductase [Pedobacter sp. MC2016-15]